MSQQDNTAEQQGRAVTRYEGNLAEFPFAVFTKGERLRKYTYNDQIRGAEGAPITRTWTIRSAHEEGLPTASTQAVLFGIMQLAHEKGWTERALNFGSLYAFLKRIGRGTAAKDYAQLAKDLEHLNAVQIDAHNAFWDTEKKAYVSVLGFKLFRYIKAYSDKPLREGAIQHALPMSTLEFEDFFFELCKTNYVRVPLSLEEMFALTPTAQKLALYLAKAFVPRNAVTHYRDVYKLAEQIPIRTSLRRQRKAKLKIAADELIARGFPLAGYEIARSANGQSEIITFHRRAGYHLGASPRSPGQGTSRPRPCPATTAPVNDADTVAYLVDEMSNATGTGDRNRRFYQLYAERLPKDLIFRAISELKESRDDYREIRTTPAQVFGGILKRMASEQGISIPQARRTPEFGRPNSRL
ncbi:MAG: hypothetical protein K8I02_04855 [Candidatus Methylomirabilis sp.]|nr:hypothetical protein [Deltaproteobacteria bacterium]